MAVEQSTLISRVKLPVGRTESPTTSLPAGTKRVTFQLTATTWNDTELLMSFEVQRYQDAGATWEHWASGEIRGTGRDKQGNLPSMTLSLTDESGYSSVLVPMPVRVVVFLNHSITVGVDMELET